MRHNLLIIVLVVALAPVPARAETALERVLTMIDSAEAPLAGQVFLNVASHSRRDDGGGKRVNSSVYYQQTRPGEALGEPPLTQVRTMAVGATNTGRVLAMDAPATSGNGWIVAANSATTTSSILAPVDIVSPDQPFAGAQISTRAVGAMNTGTLVITVNGETRD